MIPGLDEALGRLHPFHRTARAEIADLVASRSIPGESDPPSANGPASSADPFLPASQVQSDDSLDRAPAFHILLQGPAGSGKRNLAHALQRTLAGRVQVVVAEGEHAPEADRGVVVWISRDGKVPRGMPPRTPKVRVRSLSSREKVALLSMETERTARACGLDPSGFLQSDVQAILLHGGWPEAGVLGAVQRLRRLCRRRARDLAEGSSVSVDAAWASSVLGPEAHPMDPLPAHLPPGAVHSPLVSSLGGAIAQVEAFASPGGGRLLVSGAGPEVEVAAQVARSRCMALAQSLRIQADELRDLDWHIHVSGPEGPKDGASIGWPVLVAMASHLSGVQVDARFSFTGELTLSGELRSVGYVEEKFLASEREGFRRIWIPGRNLSDLSLLEPEALGSCEPVPVAHDFAALRALGLASSRS